MFLDSIPLRKCKRTKPKTWSCSNSSSPNTMC